MRNELNAELNEIINGLKNNDNEIGYYTAAIAAKNVLASIPQDSLNDAEVADFVLKFELLILKCQFMINSMPLAQAEKKLEEFAGRFKALKLKKDNLKIETDLVEIKNAIKEIKSTSRVAYVNYHYNYANNVHEYLKEINNDDESEDGNEEDLIHKRYVRAFLPEQSIADKMSLCNDALKWILEVNKDKHSFSQKEVEHCAIIHAGLLETQADFHQELAEITEDTLEKRKNYEAALEAYVTSVQLLKRNNQKVGPYLLLSCASVIDYLMTLDQNNDHLERLDYFVKLTEERVKELDAAARSEDFDDAARSELSNYRKKIDDLIDPNNNNNNNDDNYKSNKRRLTGNESSDSENEITASGSEDFPVKKKVRTKHLNREKLSKQAAKSSKPDRFFSAPQQQLHQTNEDKVGDIFLNQLTTFLNQASLYLQPNVNKNKLYIKIIKLMAFNHYNPIDEKKELKKKADLAHLLLEVAFRLDPTDRAVETLLLKLRRDGKIVPNNNIIKLINPINADNVATLYNSCLNDFYNENNKAELMKDFIQQIAPAISEMKLQTMNITTFNNKDINCYPLCKLLRMSDGNLLQTLRTFGNDFPKEYDQYIPALNQDSMFSR